MKILEIGPGTVSGKSEIFDEADTVDLFGEEPTARVEWGTDPLPFDDNHYDLVYVSNVLEYIPWYRAVTALREVKRVLKPGGELELYVPDFRYVIDNYIAKVIGDNYRMFNDAGGWMTWANSRIFGCDANAENLQHSPDPWPHRPLRAGYDATYVESRLIDADFVQCYRLANRRRRNGHCTFQQELGYIASKSV